jgi:hypothetical protein
MQQRAPSNETTSRCSCPDSRRARPIRSFKSGCIAATLRSATARPLRHPVSLALERGGRFLDHPEPSAKLVRGLAPDLRVFRLQMLKLSEHLLQIRRPRCRLGALALLDVPRGQTTGESLYRVGNTF